MKIIEIKKVVRKSISETLNNTVVAAALSLIAA
jgi:hypothetical protein